MELKTVESISEFKPYIKAWDTLINNSACGVFMHSAWLVPWFEIYGSKNPWKIFMVFNGETLIGGLPVISGTELMDYPGVKVARPAGTLPVDWVNDVSFPVSEQNSHEVIQFVWPHIMQFSQADDLFVWDILDVMDPIKDQLPKKSRLLMGFNEKYYKRYPFLELATKFEDTLQNISKKLRKNWRYYIRNLENSKKPYEYEWIKSGENVQDIMRELYHLHAQRWDDKASKSTDFMSPISQKFHSKIATSFASHGLLRFSNIKIDNKYAAILYGYVYKKKYYAIVHGLDPVWDDFSPGNLVFRHSILKAGEEGKTKYEFMKGRQRYKLRYCKESTYNVSLFWALNLKGRRVLWSEFYLQAKIWIRDNIVRRTPKHK